jgi:hypothetical protein
LFLARCNDSLLLLHDAEAAGGLRENNLRGRQSKETRNVHSDARLRRRHAQGVRVEKSLSKGMSEQIGGNRSDSTLISVVEDNEDIKEGSLGGTMDFEAEGIGY